MDTGIVWKLEMSILKTSFSLVEYVHCLNLSLRNSMNPYLLGTHLYNSVSLPNKFYEITIDSLPPKYLTELY